MQLRIIIVLLLALRTRAGAQGLRTVPIDSGTLVRLHVSNHQSVRGRLLQPLSPATANLIFCRYPGTPCTAFSDPRVETIPGAQVARLDVATGSHWVRGGLIGAAVGAALGGVFIALGNGLCDTADCKSSSRRAALGPLALGIGIGVLFGSASIVWRPAS